MDVGLIELEAASMPDLEAPLPQDYGGRSGCQTFCLQTPYFPDYSQPRSCSSPAIRTLVFKSAKNMSILITLSILAYQSRSISALPVVPWPGSTLVVPRAVDIFDNRTLLQIIWNCFATIFACTWIAVHPNIPAEKDTQWQVLGRRFAIMGYLLLAPEMVILWAARQHFGAKEISQKYKGVFIASIFHSLTLTNRHRARMDENARLFPHHGWIRAA